MANQYQHPGTDRGPSTTEDNQGDIKTRWVCFGVEVGFMLLSERVNRVKHTNLTRKSIPNSGSMDMPQRVTK